MPVQEEVVASGIGDRYGNVLLMALQDLQNGCAIILDSRYKNKVGDYHTLDKTKLFCAAEAFNLMVGLDAGRPANGNPFQSITNSLFEIVAPAEAKAWRSDHKDPPDLRTQCARVLANWRKDPAYLRSHTEELKLAFAGMIAQKSVLSMDAQPT
jgi:hypothetical protein